MTERLSLKEFGSTDWALYLIGEFPDAHPGIDWYAVAQALARRVRELEADDD